MFNTILKDGLQTKTIDRYMDLIYTEALEGTDVILGLAMQLGDCHIAEMHKQLEVKAGEKVTQDVVEALLKPWLRVL